LLLFITLLFSVVLLQKHKKNLKTLIQKLKNQEYRVSFDSYNQSTLIENTENGRSQTSIIKNYPTQQQEGTITT
jgi:hypothetical protein